MQPTEIPDEPDLLRGANTRRDGRLLLARASEYTHGTSEPASRMTVTIEDGAAEVRLNRPDKRNGLDLALFTALVAAGEGVAADKRAVVLSGAGKAFCAGPDWAASV